MSPGLEVQFFNTGHKPWESACVVLPLTIATAACGMTLQDQLDLRLLSTPLMGAIGQTPITRIASTIIGLQATILAVAAGCGVIALDSAKKHAYVRRLGASRLFDHRSAEVVKDIVKTMQHQPSLGRFP